MDERHASASGQSEADAPAARPGGEVASLQAQLDEALREVARLRNVVDAAAGHAIVSMDQDGRITGWNAPAEVITGRSAAEVLGSRARFLLDGDGPDGLRRLLDGSAAPIEQGHERPGGDRTWLSGTLACLREPKGFLAVFRNGSAAQAELERQKLLAEEMRHRLKNSYALVQAVAAQTARHEPTQEAFLAAFAARLVALARTNDLLVGDDREDMPLLQLAQALLAPHDGGLRQITVAGPEATLPSGAVTMAGLILHELATNAAKYGALSSPSGSVAVHWTTDPAARRIELHWRERGGPAVRPPESRGFGSSLLMRGLSRGIATRTDFNPEGVECTVILPLGDGTGDGSLPAVPPQSQGA